MSDRESKNLKRLAICVQTPEFGGPYNQICVLAQPLRECGWESHALVPTDAVAAVERLKEAGVVVHKLPIHRLRRTLNPRVHIAFIRSFFSETQRFKQVLHRIDPDVVQVCGLTTIQGAYAARALRVPIVWQLLGIYAPYWVRLLFLPLLIKWSDTLMTTGTSVFEKHPGTKYIKGRWLPFFPPVDGKRYKPDEEKRSRSRKFFGIEENEILIGTVGSFYPAKGHEYLVEAARILKSRDRNVKFLIIGTPVKSQASYYDKSVLEKARVLSLRDSKVVQFHTPKGSVSDLLPAMDIFALSSISEGAPTVLIEAMASGLPVVATCVGSVPEIVSDESTGFLVPPRDVDALARKLETLVLDAKSRKCMGLSARQKAKEEFSLEKCVNDHLCAFDIAISKRVNSAKKSGAAK